MAPHSCSRGLLRERLAGLALDRLLVGVDDLEPVVGAEIGVEREAVEVLVVVEDVLEHAVVHAEHDVGVHLDEAAVAVVGEALVARFGGQALHRLVVEAEVEDGVHHAGHGGARARAHRDEQRGGNVAEGGADRLADLGQRRFDLLFQAIGQLAAVGVVGGAHLGGDGEARRHRQARGSPSPRGWRPCRPAAPSCRPRRRPCRRRTGRRACPRPWRRNHACAFILRAPRALLDR